MRVVVALGVVLSLAGFGPCSSDDPTTGSGGGGGDASAPATEGGADGGCPEYESLTDVIARVGAGWVSDDAATNKTCPNSLMLTIQVWTFANTPTPLPDPHQKASCPAPSIFFEIDPHAIKSCNTNAYCATPQSVRGFYGHAYPVGLLDSLNAQGKTYPLVNEEVFLYAGGAWSSTNQQLVIESTNPQVMSFGANYTKTPGGTGTCQ